MYKALKTKTFFAAMGLAAAIMAAEPANALDKVSYGTNWLAQAEHGGFYQAVADGTYKKYGLDVTIVQGGPNAANSALLISGKLEQRVIAQTHGFQIIPGHGADIDQQQVERLRCRGRRLSTCC